MAETRTSVVNKPAWVDLATPDAAAARDFYSKVFGWEIEVSPDPQYGGYGIARIGGHDVAGIGPQMSPGPPAWSVYIGTTDAEGLAPKIQAFGGTVIAPAFDVGDQGRMAVFQDPIGAFISAWQPAEMGEFHHGGPNQFGWAELSGRGIEKALPFYQSVFGWGAKTSPPGPDGGPAYTEFQIDGDSIAGGMEMNPMVPAEVPSYWMPYFNVVDVDASFKTAVEAGAKELVAPSDYPGGRFAIVQDPQGAAFGLMKA